MDTVINIKNYVSSMRHKTEELAREVLRFQCWLSETDEVEAEAKFLERESARLMDRAETLRGKK